MADLRGGPFDGTIVPTNEGFQVYRDDSDKLLAWIPDDGSVSVPRAVTLETDEDVFRYELREEEYWYQHGPNKEDGDVDTRSFYQFVGKEGVKK